MILFRVFQNETNYKIIIFLNICFFFLNTFLGTKHSFPIFLPTWLKDRCLRLPIGYIITDREGHYSKL